MPIAAQDSQLSVTLALPAAAANNTTGIIDFQAIDPQSDSWRLGRICATVPALPNHTDSTKVITLEIQTAGASLTTSPSAPALPVPGAFGNANPRQIGSIPGVATSGSAVTKIYFTLPVDSDGSTSQFVEFLQTVPSGDGNNTASSVVYSWVAG
jgi:hypothetical protein